MVRHDNCRHNYAEERGLVVGFCGQPHYCYRPTIRQPGFDLPRHTWSVVNSFPTDQGSCHASLHKLVLAQSLSCDCGQTIKNVVDTCPLTNFEGGLNLLHETNDDAVIWLESRATAALAKYIIQPSCPGWMRTIRYDTMSYVNMRSKADYKLNLPHLQYCCMLQHY